MQYSDMADLVRKDPRYPFEAYEFAHRALEHTQKMLGRKPHAGGPVGAEAPELHHHVSGPELLQGIRDLALQDFGLMARTVFRMWGIQKTDDFGEIVFNMVEANMMSTTSEDSRADFHAVYDLDEALVKDYRIQLDEP
jgi:uncharacterized repeat protein (TIGR04138 family)